MESIDLPSRSVSLPDNDRHIIERLNPNPNRKPSAEDMLSSVDQIITRSLAPGQSVTCVIDALSDI